jgi:hypothetical protein
VSWDKTAPFGSWRGSIRSISRVCLRLAAPWLTSFFWAPQSQSHDAYVSERVTVHYRWLALHGVSLQGQRCVSRPDGEYIHYELPDGSPSAIPAWMTDPVTCAEFSLGEPFVSIEALTNLRVLLDSLRSSRPAGEGTDGNKERSDEEAAYIASANHTNSRSSENQSRAGRKRAIC